MYKRQVSDTGWYTSDLRIVPKDGYELLREEEGKTLDEIALTKDTDCGEEKFYIMNAVSYTHLRVLRYL